MDIRSEIFWIAVGSIAQIGIFVGVPLSILMAIRSSRREERDHFYARLDEMYFNIQQLIVQYPHLIDPARARTKEEVVQYNSFAFMVWNFVESIHDYCSDDPVLAKTWRCIMVLEGRQHAEWFNRAENRVRFKSSFCDYIDRNGLATI